MVFLKTIGKFFKVNLWNDAKNKLSRFRVFLKKKNVNTFIN